MGNILEYLIYEKYYKNEKVLSFCGFKKFHPHNLDSTLRIAYLENTDKKNISQHLRIIANDAISIFKKVYSIF
jgi:DNA-directed RNA polymerase subunit L